MFALSFLPQQQHCQTLAMAYGILMVCFIIGWQLQSNLSTAAGSRDPHADKDVLPGWMGSDHTAPDVLSSRQSHMEVLHADARVFLFKKFLSPDECDAVIAQAEPNMAESGVALIAANTSSVKSQFDTRVRSSYNTFLSRGANPLIKDIEARMAAWALLPVENGESMQVLRYEPGQQYKPHMDYLFAPQANAEGGGRVATVLVYATDVEEGGETYFPNLPALPGDTNQYSDCAKGHLAVKPRKGDAILFHSMALNGTVDYRSLHGSCPVIKGTKWALTKWIHMHALN